MKKYGRRYAKTLLTVAVIFSLILGDIGAYVAQAADAEKVPIKIEIAQDLKYSNTPTNLSIIVTYSDGSREERLADSWHSDNTQVAYVKNHKLYFNGYNGKVTITAYFGDLRASRTVDVIRYPESSLMRVQIEGNLAYSESPVQLRLRGFFSDDTSAIIDGTVSWRSSNVKVATVDGTGKLTFTGENGVVTIHARFGSLEDSETVVVNNPVPSRIEIAGDISSFPDTVKLSVLAHFPDGSKKVISHGVKWRTSDPNTASVSEDGTVHFHRNFGRVTIQATYLGRTAEISAERSPDTVENLVLEGSLSFSTRRERQLSVKAFRANGQIDVIDLEKVAWTTNDPEIATVDEKGYLVYRGKSGNLTVFATYGGKTASKTAYIQVPKVERLEFVGTFPENAKIIRLRLRAVYASPYGTAEVDPRSVVWSSSDESVAKVSEDGTVEFTERGGTATVSAKYAGLEVSKVLERQGRKPSPQVLYKVDKSRVIENLEKRRESPEYGSVANFADVRGHWAAHEILVARRHGLVSGYGKDLFGPDRPITRAEFVTLVANFLRPEGTSGRQEFSDVRNHWAEQSIYAAYGSGLVGGYPDGTFRPDSSITRAEIATILARIVDFSVVEKRYDFSFADTDAHWAKEAIKRLADAGVVMGLGKDTFAPERQATRAESVVLVLRVLRLDSEIASVLR